MQWLSVQHIVSRQRIPPKIASRYSAIFFWFGRLQWFSRERITGYLQTVKIWVLQLLFTWWSVSSDMQAPISNLSNKRRSISSDTQTPITNISNPRGSVLSHVYAPRNNISDTRRSVSRHRYLIYQEQEGVFRQISRHREITYQTRELKKCFISFPGK